MSSFLSRKFAVAASMALLCSPVFAQGVDCCERKPGSVLIYPIHRTGPDRVTILCVTNTNTNPATPNSFGGSVTLHFEYVNTQPSSKTFRPQQCTIFDRMEFLTPADTLCVLTACHNPTFGDGQDGYVVVSAQSPSGFNQPIDHDYLIGSECVISASGVAYCINAISVRALGIEGQQVSFDDVLDFDGVEYEALPDRLYIDSFLAMDQSRLNLLNLTGTHQDLNTVYFAVWNDNEFPLSATLTFNCWFDEPLTTVSPLFSQAFLLSTPHDPQEIDIDCDGVGDMEGGWAIVDSVGVHRPDGIRVANDGVLLGSITGGCGGRLLWCENVPQTNGQFLAH